MALRGAPAPLASSTHPSFTRLSGPLPPLPRRLVAPPAHATPPDFDESEFDQYDYDYEPTKKIGMKGKNIADDLLDFWLAGPKMRKWYDEQEDEGVEAVKASLAREEAEKKRLADLDSDSDLLSTSTTSTISTSTTSTTSTLDAASESPDASSSSSISALSASATSSRGPATATATARDGVLILGADTLFGEAVTMQVTP